MDTLSTLECYIKIYKSIGKSSENIRKKGLTYCMKKDLKSMQSVALQQLRRNMITAYKSSRGVNTRKWGVWWP